VPRLARLLATCRARGVPVLYIAFVASHRGEASRRPVMMNSAVPPKEPQPPHS
jgi:nicotinamidase-related amidase